MQFFSSFMDFAMHEALVSQTTNIRTILTTFQFKKPIKYIEEPAL
ncbi:hypothetical protein SAMN05443663_10960 [Flavobacterium defluvii]|uniref:Uncharacterized protein n=1 Tax=Flavobacterium defluvii TaxID=370979 RepID=A0A1M5UJ95_9FLAO|nr:hypothetical protein SAMN05443663_10960 [Flavobacterium defluvii]